MNRKQSHIRRTPEEIAELLRRYDDSGLSQKRFASEHGIPVSTLGLWLRGRRSQKATGIEVVPVQLSDAARGSVIEIVVRGDRLVRVDTGFDTESLSKVIDVLESC